MGQSFWRVCSISEPWRVLRARCTWTVEYDMRYSWRVKVRVREKWIRVSCEHILGRRQLLVTVSVATSSSSTVLHHIVRPPFHCCSCIINDENIRKIFNGHNAIMVVVLGWSLPVAPTDDRCCVVATLLPSRTADGSPLSLTTRKTQKDGIHAKGLVAIKNESVMWYGARWTASIYNFLSLRVGTVRLDRRNSSQAASLTAIINSVDKLPLNFESVLRFLFRSKCSSIITIKNYLPQHRAYDFKAFQFLYAYHVLW